MFIVRRGDYSPRVVLLQILLNRQGAGLVVDGIFGRLTDAAVASFQGIGPISDARGVAGPATWRELLRRGNETVVDVVDVGDPLLATREAIELTAAGSSPITLGLMCNGVGQMVSDVQRRVGEQQRLAVLRITGHGNFGRWMTVSVGSVAHLPRPEYREVAGEYFSYIDDAHFHKVAPLLSQLQPYFLPYGSMEHTGCSIGSRPESRHLMQRLANLWGVPVSAGIPQQAAVLRFDGAVFTVYPGGGTLASWSRRFRDRPL
jgi:hypothetical protein